MAYLRSKNGAPRRPHPAEVARGNRFLRPAPDKAIEVLRTERLRAARQVVPLVSKSPEPG